MPAAASALASLLREGPVRQLFTRAGASPSFMAALAAVLHPAGLRGVTAACRVHEQWYQWLSVNLGCVLDIGKWGHKQCRKCRVQAGCSC